MSSLGFDTPTLQDEIDTAQIIATLAHFGQYRADGSPYLSHVEIVVQRVSKQYQPTAWLHDVLEDNKHFTPEKLRAVGISVGTLGSVALLTHNPEWEYADYINRIILSGDRQAMWVKLADLSHNMETGALWRPGKMARYTAARDVLTMALEKE